jgi:phosphatidylethanolamine/phosphatidyl-N-methylethanolamine N-methyltransferase
MPGSRLADYGIFLKQFVEQFHTTGAVMPSGKLLAAALCRYVGSSSGPQRILEVGPGTGAVTTTLVERMRDEDHLCLIEINQTFVTHLKTAFKERPPLRAKAHRVDVIHGRLEDLTDDGGYDLIVSGLPLNNFSVEAVAQILDGFGRLLKPGGVLSFFEYIALRSVRSRVGSKEDRERVRAISGLLHRMLDGREIQRDWVWPNVPPAWVHHVKLHGAGQP